jgi:hypothetical protein
MLQLGCAPLPEFLLLRRRQRREEVFGRSCSRPVYRKSDGKRAPCCEEQA